MATAPPRPFHGRRMGGSSTGWAVPPSSGSASPPRPLVHPRMSISAASGDRSSPGFTLPLSPPPNPQQQQDQHSPASSNVAPFRPSIAIVVGVLTTMFSITFLLLLYAKHCKRGSSGSGRNGGNGSGFPNHLPAPRRNSGVERCVVESLPLFRFGVLVGQKADSGGSGGLECAVCLNRFDPAELLRLLPKCKHAFHVECVDTWLDAHSTCPLCRCRVDPEDAFLIPAVDHKMGVAPVESSTGVDGDGGGEVDDPGNVQQQARGEEEGDGGQLGEDGNGGTRKSLCDGTGGGSELPGSGEVPGILPPSGANSASNGNNDSYYSGCGPFNLRPGRGSFSLSSLTGRHSSAGEKSSGTKLLQVVVERPGRRRKSIDDAILQNGAAAPLAFRRKDCLLMTTSDRTQAASTTVLENQEEIERRFGHCIVVSDTVNNGIRGGGGGSMRDPQRWSDLKPSDLLVLRREMILSAAESARYSASARAARVSSSSSAVCSPSRASAAAIDGRCASEITGLSRLGVPRPAAIQEERVRALRKKWQGFSAWRTGLWPTARGGGGGRGGNGPSR